MSKRCIMGRNTHNGKNDFIIWSINYKRTIQTNRQQSALPFLPLELIKRKLRQQPETLNSSTHVVAVSLQYMLTFCTALV